MIIRTRLFPLVRWLFRWPEPVPPPGIGQRYQEVEQAAAVQRLLDHAVRLPESPRAGAALRDVTATGDQRGTGETGSLQ